MICRSPLTEHRTKMIHDMYEPVQDKADMIILVTIQTYPQISYALMPPIINRICLIT